MIIRSMDLRSRLIAGFMVMAAIVGVSTAVSLWGLSQNASHFSKQISYQSQVTEKAINAAAAAHAMRQYEKDLFLHIDNKTEQIRYMSLWQSQYDLFSHDIDDLTMLVEGTPHAENIKLMSGAQNYYRASLKQILADMEVGIITTPQAANQAIAPHKDAGGHLMVSESNKLATSFYAQLHQTMGATDLRISRMRIILWTSAGMAILLALILGTVASNSVTRPITHLIDVARRLSQGDLAQEANDLGTDELFRLEIGLKAEATQAFGGGRGDRAELKRT